MVRGGRPSEALLHCERCHVRAAVHLPSLAAPFVRVVSTRRYVQITS